MKRCVTYTILAAVIFLSSSVQAGGGKTWICHLDPHDGRLYPLLVSNSAIPAHEAHGDVFGVPQARPNPQGPADYPVCPVY